jgi:hypothetical protein
MVVSVAEIVMIVVNVDLIMFFKLKLDYVLKYVVMEKDILQVVMMVIILMVMDVVKIVKYKLVIHVMVDQPTQEIHAQVFYQVKSHSKIKVNQDFMVKLSSMSKLTIFQKLY